MPSGPSSLPLFLPTRPGALLRNLLAVLCLLAAVPAPAQVVISEFMAENPLGRKDEDGDYEDWIELHNPGSTPARLAGWFLTDSAATPRRWEFPDVTLDPGGFLVVFASNKDRRVPGRNLHTNFRLAAGGEYLALLRPDLSVATAFAPAYPPQVPGVSYGFPAAAAAVPLLAAGAPARFLVPTDDTLGTNWLAADFPDAAWTSVILPVGWDTGGTTADVAVADSVADWSPTGESGFRGWTYGTYSKATDPNGSYSAAEFVPFGAGEWNGSLWRTPAAGTARATLGPTDGRPAGSNNGGERWVIRRWVSTVTGPVTVQWRLAKRAAGGTGVNARVFHGGIQRDTVTLAGESLADVTRTVIIPNVQAGEPIDLALTPLGSGAATDDTGDDARFSMTLSAPASLTHLIRTDVSAALRGRNASAYLRVPFTVTNLADLDSLELRIRHDDGFAAFLNGHLVAQRNAPVETAGGVVGDQDDDWAGTDDQGVKGWYYGLYDQAADPDHTYDAFADFDNVDPLWAWNGDAWTLGPGDPPWTTLGRASWHPNGNAGGANVQWAIRRWVCQTAGTVKVLLAGAKENAACGNGVTFRLLVNGTPRFARTLAFDDTAGFATTVVLENLGFGDYVDFGLDPSGTDGDTADGCDGSTFAARILQDAQPGLTWNSTALRARDPAETARPEIVDLSRSRDRLQPGTNILALHVLNVAAEDADFLAAPELHGRFARVETGQGRYFTSPTPGSFNQGGTETLGPVIESVDATPRVPADAEDLTVTATVRRTLRPIASVTLTYRVQFDAERTTPMFDDGAHGDGTAGDGVWGARIPAAAAAAGQMVRWAVGTLDDAGAGLRSPPYPDPRRSPQYFGTMVDDPALAAHPIPVLHWFIQTPAAADSDAGGRGSLFFAGEFYDNILANLHGQSTRGFPKKSYDFDFNPGYNFRWREGQPRVDDFNLLTTWADKSHFRNVLAYETFEQAGAPAHFAFPVRVQQNGRFHSLANLVENGDDNFLERLGLDPRGALYKMYNTANSAAGNEKKTRKEEGTQDLAALIQALGTGTTAARQTAMFDQLDVPEVVNFLATLALTGDTDCCHKNYYLYRDTDGSAQWLALPWDVDLSFGRVWTCGSPCFAYYDETIYTNTGLFVGDNNTVFSLVLNTAATRAMYTRRLRTLMDDLTQPPGVAPATDRWLLRSSQLRDLLAPDAALDLAKWGTWGRRETITQAVDRIHREFLPGRRTFLFQTSVRAGTLPATQPADATVRFGPLDFRPASGNPLHEYLTLTNPNPYAVDVSDWQLAGDVRFRFTPGTVLPARSSAFVSPSRREFRTRPSSPRGGEGRLVLGDYQGRLSARGGTLELLDRTGRLVDSRAFAGAPSPAQDSLCISEILYHARRDGGSPDVEFVELRNTGTQPLDLTGVRFVEGISFDFGSAAVRILAPGAFVLVVNSLAAFEQAYGPGSPIAGAFTGSLDDSGERLRLEDAAGEPVLDFRYPTDAVPAADGHGFSLVPVDPAADPGTWDEPGRWRASASPGGSPGRPDAATGAALPPVILSEILTHTDPPQVDAIELHNASDRPADIGGWFLSDRSAQPAKFRVPDGTVIPPHGFAVFDETHFNRPTNAPTSFALSSHGDTVWLFAADAAGHLTGYADSVSVPASANGVSFGRHVDSTGTIRFPPQRELSLGRTNSGPRVGPVVLAEIHARPARGESPFVEIRNVTAQPVPLHDPAAPTNTWRLAGLDLAFPPGLTLPPGGLLLAVGGDPAEFRLHHGIPSNIPVVGPWPGSLHPGNERLALERPDAPDLLPDGTWFVPFLEVDEVHYSTRPPWPDLDRAPGASLERLAPGAYGDEPRNWRASVSAPTPGTTSDANRPPVVAAGPDQTLEASRFPALVTLAGSARDDGLPADPGTVALDWSQVEGPGLAEFADASRSNTVVHLPGPGRFVLRLTAFDGAAAGSADLVVQVARPGSTPTLVPTGAAWSYLATGRDPAANWAAPEFDDGSWTIGATQIGYGDGDETTVLPADIAGARLLTVYFRKTFMLPDAAGARSLTLRLLRDDGAALWLNGRPALRVNLPEGPLTYATPATATVSGTEESTYFEHALDPALLRDGVNVIAAEVHQQSAGSSDLSFDLELAASLQPTNHPPAASAGPDASVAIGQPHRLAGAWSDDGLPQAATLRWTQLSGPAPATLSATNLASPWASLPAAGSYTLRFTVSDGPFTALDEVRLVAGEDADAAYRAWKERHFSAAEQADPRISGDTADPDGDGQANLAEYQSGTLPRDPASVLRLSAALGTDGSVRLTFPAIATRSYRCEMRPAASSGPWQVIQRVEPLPTDQPVLLLDPTPPLSQSARFYRIVTPAD